MKTITIFLSLIMMSCNSQKDTSKKEISQNKIVKDTIIKKGVFKDPIKKGNPAKKSQTPNNKPQTNVLLQGSHGGYEVSKYSIIKDQKTLEEAYAQINKTRKPGFPVPTIDFKDELVIALFMGQKNSGGHSISIDKISTNSNGKTEILVKEKRPTGMATSVITQPFYFYKIKRTDKEIVFKKVE